MTEYAPAGITSLFDQIQAAIPAALLGGIIGDSAHTYGYHRGRNYVGADDYSVQLAEDQQGDGEAACGLDISWTDASWQYTCSQRLLDAANDSRMYPVREFYGSVDGVHVIGWDYAGGYPVTSDQSHTWHIHLSVLRRYAGDPAALSGVAAVITGSGGGSSGAEEGDWFDMATMEDLKTAVRGVLNEGTAQGQQNWAGTSKATLGSVQGLVNQVNALKGQVAAMEASVLAAIEEDAS